MSSQTLTLTVPDNIFARIRERARQAKRTVEAEALEVLSDAVAPDDESLPPDIEAAVAAVGLLDEEGLRVAAESRLTKQESDRLAELHYKRQRVGRLTLRENKECRELIHRYEKAMVVRAKALAELRKRGVDITEFVTP